MRKNLFVFLLLLACQISNAQFNTGQKVLSGSFNIQNLHSKDSANNSSGNNFSFTLNPTFGKFKDEKTLIEYGLLLSYGENKNIINGTSQKSSFYSIGGTYSLTKLITLTNKIFFTLGFGGSVVHNNNMVTLSNNQQKSRVYGFGINAGITPGLLFPISKKVLLKTGFNNILNVYYNINSYRNTNFSNAPISNSNFGISAGTTPTTISGLYLGFSLLL